MDENLTNEITGKENYLVNFQEVEAEVGVVEDETASVDTAEIEEIATVYEPEAIEITIEEGIGYVAGEAGLHATLPDRNSPNQHVIDAVTGLREELDSLNTVKTPQTLYSDSANVATYCEWASGAYDTHGYFVSVVDGDKIQICDGSDIFGVVVDAAGFVGNQSMVVRDASYGLVVTSGLVDVRCELDVEVGDCVISNSHGCAKKSESNYGYKVFGTETKNGVYYAIIALGVQMDIISDLDIDLSATKEQVNENYKNIVSAINVANQAYNKSMEACESSYVSEVAVKEALESILKSEEKIEEFEQVVGNVSTASAQAKAIAESAATSAESMKNEAIAEANKALDETSKLRDSFGAMENQFANIEGQVTIVTKQVNGRYEIVDTIDGIKKQDDTVYYAKDTEKYHYYNYDIPDWTETTNPREAGLPVAIAGIQVETDDNSSRINNLVSWQGDAKTSMARIEQKADANGAYIHSIVSNMDKYAVGPYSQANGFTLENARVVLEEGMIYVPTVNKLGNAAEGYEYTDSDGKTQTLEREFSQGYLYRWGKLDDSYGDLYCWITVDRDYSEDKLNTSSPAVYFSTTAPSILEECGYWYTNGDEVDEGYEPYTLYKWESYVGEDESAQYHWVAVATLTGNSQARAVSQVRQDTNSIASEITDVKGDVVKIEEKVNDTEAAITSLTTWKNGGETSEGIIRQTSNDNGASITISAYQRDDGGNILNTASLVLSTSTKEPSSLVVDAKNVLFTAEDYGVIADNITLDASKITLDGTTSFITSDDEDGTTKIDGSKIATGSIEAKSINTTGLAAERIEVKDSKSRKIFSASAEDNNVVLGGWNADFNSLYYETDKAFLCPSGWLTSNKITIGTFTPTKEDTTTYWAAKIGKKFGVTVGGVVHCTDVHISGNSSLGELAQQFKFGASRFDNTESSSIYLRDNIFSGMGGLGTPSDNYVYIGGDGLSYWDGKSDTFDYNTAIRPGFVFCSGDKGGKQSNNVAVAYTHHGIDFYYGGGNKLRTATKVYSNATNIVNMEMKSDGVHITGTITGNTSGSIVSDRNKKNSINTFSDEYNVLFDGLIPIKYKYNYGTSGRFHSGFIAQDVLQAINNSGLTTQDFAAYVETKDDDENITCAIRYDEFIALNTWQIQKLKTRVTELETKVAELEAKLKD